MADNNKIRAIIAIVLISLAVGEAAVMRDGEDELPLAGPCNQTACQLPDCRCSSTNIPGGLEAKDTPQFVLVTFDDGVNVNNIYTYRDILYGRTNKNGCPAGATFFINHEYTNYQLVNELYNEGFEPALHSMTHQTPQSYWSFADYEDMMEEFGDQKGQMAHFANIPEKEIKGVRIPFLQMTGNVSFQVMQEVGLDYDCTWTSQNPPGFWPYTLDYASTQECFIPPCPTASLPGPWVLPMVSWKDLNGVACAMVDACYNIPDHDDEDAWLEFIVTNFENHYLGNRAPFGFFIHEWYLATYPSVKNGLKRFLDMINEMHDVFMVNGGQVIDWVKNPVPLNEYVNTNCRTFDHTLCQASNCGPLSADHTETQYYMQICGSCPSNYPWRGNPLGL